MAVLEASGLTLSFGLTPALGGVSLAVGVGETVAVMGPSGSGKSTLLHCLAGLRRPDSGEVQLGGEPFSNLSDRSRSDVRLRRLGVVFQFAELLPELTMVENVSLPAWIDGNERDASRKSAEGLLDRFGIAHLADRHPGEVSGGERQRAAVARALVHEPALVLADEPTGALDSVNGQLVLDALMDQARVQGAAVVLVTHEARLASLCDREVLMRDGRIVEPVAALR